VVVVIVIEVFMKMKYCKAPVPGTDLNLEWRRLKCPRPQAVALLHLTHSHKCPREALITSTWAQSPGVIILHSTRANGFLLRQGSMNREALIQASTVYSVQ
jgi:hypothetical protein